jgi:crotonobetainyl-CoA:carnitine CoA-transferase CaiB-like acyl-CoA transferase
VLSPYKVLDLTDVRGHYAGALLATLGADVLKVEPLDGDPLRRRGPFYGGEAGTDCSLYWWALNTNKRGITLDLTQAEGQATLRELASRADIIIESYAPGYLDSIGLGYAALSAANPGLVMASITPFGQDGPYRDYKGSDLVAWAMGGLASQSGDPDHPPVRISHLDFSYLMGSLDAAWGTLAAINWRASSGLGQQVDVSLQESMIKSTFLTHEYWQITGMERTRGSSYYRVPWTDLYLRTVWPTQDGVVYFMIHGGEFGSRENPVFLAWMEEEGIADDYIRGIDWYNLEWKDRTLEDVAKIEAYFGELFKRKTRAQITEAALERHIVLQTINSPRDIIQNVQLEARGFWTPVKHEDVGAEIGYPSRFVLASAAPENKLRRAPHLGEHNDSAPAEWFKTAPRTARETAGAPAKALAGIRVVSFEQALAAPLLTSIMAAYGAEVIRVETGTRLDWHRQAGPFIGNVNHVDRSVPYLFINSGKKGITLNLKQEKGVATIKDLVAQADVVVENFAGGVMQKLGLGYEDLKAVKPDLIMLSAAIYGQTGPYATMKGHGNPLTALTGLPHLTGAPDQLPQYPGFVITDFTAPRAALVGLLAALDHHRRTGVGQYLDASQFESAVHLLTPVLLPLLANDEELNRIGNHSTQAAPHNIYPCAGDDRWCAISVFTETEWRACCEVTGHPEWAADARFATLTARLENQAALDELMTAWTTGQTPEAVMQALQAAGVAAGVVQTGADLDADPHLSARGFYWKLSHEGDIGDFTYTGMPVKLSRTPYEVTPAPLLGEHNEQVLTEILGLSDEDFVALIVDGVVE